MNDLGCCSSDSSNDHGGGDVVVVVAVLVLVVVVVTWTTLRSVIAKGIKSVHFNTKRQIQVVIFS